MTHQIIQDAVLEFITLMQPQSDKILDYEWGWESYTSEGIRFAFFRTYEELIELSVLLMAERSQQGIAVTQAQNILAGYHSACRDLQAILSAAAPEIRIQSLGKDAWSIRQTLNHIIAADIGFFGIVQYALERFRGSPERPEKMTDADWEAITGLTEEKYDALFESGYEDLIAYHTRLQHQILSAFAGIRGDELQNTIAYWETNAMPTIFRLLRFESHMRQHTIQIEKTLAAIVGGPTEVNRLIRLIFSGLAAVENACIGAPQIGLQLLENTAQAITARTGSLRKILESDPAYT